MAVPLLKTGKYVHLLCSKSALRGGCFSGFSLQLYQKHDLSRHVLLSPLLDSGFLKYCILDRHVLFSLC